MKKMFTFFFAVLIALSLFACQDDEPTTPTEPTDPTVVPTEPTALPTEGTGYGVVHGHYVGVVDVVVGTDGNVTSASVEEYFLPYSWAKVDVARTAIGYGLVHGHYVGVIEVTINAAGNVTAAEVEEYFLPYSAAKVVVADPENLPADVMSVTGSRGTSYYAKYFSVDGILFTGTVNGDAPAQSITYAADGIDNIEVWVETEANAKRYVEAVEAGTVFIANEDGTASSYAMADNSAKVSMKKSESGYWSGVNYPLGWAGNMAAFVTAITGTKLNASLETIVKNTETGFWSIGTIVTGATMTDFKDYYEVAQRGYATALTVVPAGTLRVATSRGVNLYSQYIMVDGILWTGSVTGEGTAQGIEYKSMGSEIEDWADNPTNAKRYIEAVEAGLVFTSNAQGEPTNWPLADNSAKVSMKKSESGYWSGSNYPLGWAGNMAEFIEAITGTKLDASLESMVKDSTTGFWSIGSVVTGATMSDFKDYYSVAQRAYNNAE
ncbi:MAG: hypothetical protein EP317_01155 [Bacillota bacterium]|nr:MAG: hypothetical protein EP317_01155 [Bacillota bacterium]